MVFIPRRASRANATVQWHVTNNLDTNFALVDLDIQLLTANKSNEEHSNTCLIQVLLTACADHIVANSTEHSYVTHEYTPLIIATPANMNTSKHT
jgi:phosphopantothenoylcysteine synthetase/decarboxylase